MTKYILFALIFLLVAPESVHAYIDPGTGSYLTQVVAGFVFGGVVMLKVYGKKIKDFISKLRSHNKVDDEKSHG